MTLTILASGSKANCAIVQFGDAKIMIDCGLPAAETFKRMIFAGIAPESLSAIVISHEHLDHAGALAQILGKLDIPAYLSGGTLAALNVEKLRRPRLMIFQAGARFDIGGVKVGTFSVPHDAADPVGFTFTGDSERLAWVTDLGSIGPTVGPRLRGADVLFCESNHDFDVLQAGPYPPALKRRVAGPLGHLSNEAVAEFLRGDMAGTSRVILGHLSLGNNDEALCRMTAEEALGGRCELMLAGTDGGLS